MHSTTIHVRWGELDPYNHVNHATYLSYLEHARIAALDSIGWGMDVIAAAGYQVVVVGIDIRFRSPATAGDTLTIDTSLKRLGASESAWSQVIRRGDEVLEPVAGRQRLRTGRGGRRAAADDQPLDRDAALLHAERDTQIAPIGTCSGNLHVAPCAPGRPRVAARA